MTKIYTNRISSNLTNTSLKDSSAMMQELSSPVLKATNRLIENLSKQQCQVLIDYQLKDNKLQLNITNAEFKAFAVIVR